MAHRQIERRSRGPRDFYDDGIIEIPTARTNRGAGPLHHGHDHDQFEIVEVPTGNNSSRYEFRWGKVYD